MLEAASDISCTTDGPAYTYRFMDDSRRIIERRRTDGSGAVRFILGG